MGVFASKAKYSAGDICGVTWARLLMGPPNWRLIGRGKLCPLAGAWIGLRKQGQSWGLRAGHCPSDLLLLQHALRVEVADAAALAARGGIDGGVDERRFPRVHRRADGT